MADWTLEQELIKTGLAGAVSLLTLGLGWFVGVRITATWTLRQKRRELELSAANELYRLYGEFFAVWKLWNYLRSGNISLEIKDARWELMKRAALVDAGFEALLVKLSSERLVPKSTIEDAGLLRQGFQQLRQNIKSDKPLNWNYAEHPEYLAFKRLACSIANFITADHKWKHPESATAAATLKEITSNLNETRWNDILNPPPPPAPAQLAKTKKPAR